MPKMEENTDTKVEETKVEETKVDETKVDEVEETGDESENLEPDVPESNDSEPEEPNELQMINERINLMNEKLGMLTEMLVPLSEKLDNFVQDMNVIKPKEDIKPQPSLEELSKNFV